MNSIKSILIFLAIIIFFMISCGKKSIPQITEADPLYSNAVDLYSKGKFEKASENFLEFKNRFPFDSRINEVEIKYCDSLYKAEMYIEAENAYLDFIKLHPKNELVPYAKYQLGMVQFQQISTIDRDQSKLHLAYDYFSALTKEFPNSKYSAIATHRMHECKRKIAKNNFYIGYFYFKKKNYKAAIYRFEEVLQKYPGYIDDKVLYYLGSSLLLKGEENKGKDCLKKVVDNFPKSKYHQRSANTLKTLKPKPFSFTQRVKEYYFHDELDVKDKYYISGYQSFSYPASPEDIMESADLLDKKRTFVTMETSEKVKAEVAEAEESSKKDNDRGIIPVNVSANKVTYLKSDQEVLFEGDVVVSRGDLTINSNKIIAFLDNSTQSIKKIEALNNVLVTYFTKEGSAEKVTYFVKEDKVEFEGKPYLKDGKNYINGEKIIFFVKKEQVFVTGDKKNRSKIIIQGD